MALRSSCAIDPTFSQAHVEFHSCPKCDLQVLPLFEQYSAQNLASTKQALCDLPLQMSSILFGDTMVPNLGYSILYKEYYLTRFNHQKTHYSDDWPVLVASNHSVDSATDRKSTLHYDAAAVSYHPFPTRGWKLLQEWRP